MSKSEKSNIGHNKPPEDKPAKKAKSNKGGADGKKIRSYVERIERLDEERVAVVGDIREVYAEVKAAGFDTKVLRTMIQRRKRDAAELAEMEAILDLYEHAMEDE